MFDVCGLTKGDTDKRTCAQGDVLVRSPRRGGLTRVLTGMGATVLAEPGGGLSVTGLEAWRIAAAAAAHWIPIQELTPRSGLNPLVIDVCLASCSEISRSKGKRHEFTKK